MFVLAVTAAHAQKVTVRAVNQPASVVFRTIMDQTGKNFVYSSEVLKDIKVSVNAHNQPLRKVLDEMFKGKGISYKIKGNNVILKKIELKRPEAAKSKTQKRSSIPDTIKATTLKEVIITYPPESSAVETVEIGFKKISGEQINRTPTLFGENDMIKTLHLLPGVSEGMEGMAGMYVDGGNHDENLYLIDNVPLYQVNHFGGLFSAFNTDIINNASFYKTSIPAKFDGRLSSYTDVKLISADKPGHHGSGRIGLTSGAFNISGPIGNKTSYLFGIRRSWFDVLTVPFFALINSYSQDEKYSLHYYFTDLNAKITHNFSSALSGFIAAYYSNDYLSVNSEDKTDPLTQWHNKSKASLNWGNLIVEAGMNYQINPSLSSEFTLAYSNPFGYTKIFEHDSYPFEAEIWDYGTTFKSENSIKDFILKGDFEWHPRDNMRSFFGGSYILHSFLPNKYYREISFNESYARFKNNVWSFLANEAAAYFDYDWNISDKLRLAAGIHGSVFNADGKTHFGASPRFSLNYHPKKNFAFKASYAHLVQYVFQLSTSYLSLPTDQWIPVAGGFKPENADKVAIGGYWNSNNRTYEIGLETYYKKMNNLIELTDEYYLLPPQKTWTDYLTSGSGTSKGISVYFEKKTGRLTGRISYTLAWADRLFKEKNGGQRYPFRYDNRHTINASLNWDINDKVSLNAVWVGHSGNHVTLMTHSYEAPDFGVHEPWFPSEIPLKTKLNNYQLPFYHRLDLSCTVKNKRGYWTFGLYNAYCHMNAVAIVRGTHFSQYISPEGNYYSDLKPVFKKLTLFPLIPSISYTWIF